MNRLTIQTIFNGGFMLKEFYAPVMILVALYGLCVGSFLNVVICRLPKGEKMGNERSHCTSCGNMIKWYDNIPLISYIVLRGKCRKCGERISFRYPLNESLNMLLWILSFVIFKDNLIYAVICSLVCSVAICVFWIDFDCGLIYDRFNIILIVLGVVSLFVYDGILWYDGIIAAFTGAIVFYLIGFAVSKKVGTEALGMGDIKLAFSMGLILGCGKLLLAVLLASIIGCIVLIPLSKAENSEKNHEFPFGPFLTSGLVTALLFGDYIIDLYMNLLA